MREDFVTDRVMAAALRHNPLIPAGVIAFLLVAVLAGVFMSIGTAFAHHNTYSASVNCAGDWTANANYVGGSSRRLIVISDVKVNGVAYDPSWSSGFSGSILPYSLSTSDFQTGEAPGGTPDYMWDGTDNGWNIFNRSGTANFTNAAGSWTGTIYMYELQSGKWSKADTDNVTAPTQPTNCGTIIIKKVLRGGDPAQIFTADLNQVGDNTYDENNIPFSVNTPASRTVLANGTQDYDVTEDSPPSGYTFVGKTLLAGNVACPSSTSTDWTFTTDRKVDVDNLAAGATKTVCFLNQPVCEGAGDSYDASLTSPTVPNASDTFTWQITGAKPGPGCEISHIELSGCWEKDDIETVTATGANGNIPSGDIEKQNDGTVKIDGLQDDDLPLSVTITFFSTYSSGNNLATIFIKTGGGANVGVAFLVGGPTCETPKGDITVCKEVIPQTDTSLWDFTLTGPSPGTATDLGDGDCKTWNDRDPGAYTITEQTAAGYKTTMECNVQYTTGTGSVSFTLASGGSVTCTFTNTRLGKITVCKDVEPDDDQTTEWDVDLFNAAGARVGTAEDLVDEGDCHTFYDLEAGTYYLDEVTKPGYETTVECDNGASEDGDRIEVNLMPGDHVTCTFTNTAKARITVCKDVEPDDDSLWDFNLTGQPQATGLEDEGDCHTWEDLPPGQYTLSEVTQPGYDESVSCDNGQSNNTANIVLNLSAGDDITCTFLNEHAKVTVCKEVQPVSDPNTWTFNVNGTTGDFTTGQLGHDDCESFSPLESGIYVVSENTEPGYSTSVQCDNGAAGIAVTKFPLSPGDNVTCTFTNTKLGEITVCKETDPNDSPQVFQFTSAQPIGNFSLGDGDCDTTQNLPAGDYSVAETVPADWELTDIDCATADVTETPPSVTIHLGVGDDVTCTFYNTEDGSIEVCKQTDPDGSSEQFDIELDGSFLVSLQDGDCSTTSLAPGTYDVTEDVPAAWELTDVQCDPTADGEILNGVSINLSAGEEVTCTFYNLELGTITICKETDPANSPEEFEFTGSFDSFTLTDGDCETFSDLEPGGYSVEESVPEGWELIDILCNKGADAGTGETGVEIELHAGEEVTCTFYNEELGTIVICKETVPSETGGTFDFTSDLGDFSVTAGDCVTFEDLEPGTTYDVSEIVPEGWILTNVVCQGGDTGSIQDGVSIELTAGDVITCTFINSAPGTVTIIKLTQPSSDNSTDFNFTGSFGPFVLTGNNDSTTFINVLAGNYNVNETPTVGWTLTTIDCGDAKAIISDTGASFEVPVGGAVTCVFTNVEDSSLTIIKQTIPNGSPQLFDFTGDIGDFTLGDGGMEVADPIAPGIYRIDEIIPAGWELLGVDCLGAASDDATGVTVMISPGEDEVCIFTNEEQPKETPEPTPSPTPEPTPTPTGTIIETPPPTDEPTPPPTDEPTPPPTDEPTPPPTGEPTPTPTPTVEPTEEPTPPPTDEPTPPPTEEPTPPPTDEPTPGPTDVPTPTPPVAEATQTPVPTSLPAVFPPTGGSTGAPSDSFMLLLVAGGAAFIIGTILILGGIRREDR